MCISFIMLLYPCVYREHRPTETRMRIIVGLSLCIQGTRFLETSNVDCVAVYPCVYREHIHN